MACSQNPTLQDLQTNKNQTTIKMYVIYMFILKGRRVGRSPQDLFFTDVASMFRDLL